MDQTQDSKILRWRAVRNTGASLFALGILAACSSVPDAVNPVEWYRSASDLVSGESDAAPSQEAATAQAETAAVPGADEPFPNLASVPDRPSVLTGDNVASGLIADPNKPEYAAAPSRQGDDDLPPPPAAISEVGSQPAPPALPVEPVTAEAVTALAQVPPPSEPAVATQQPLSQPAAVVPASVPLVVKPGYLPSGETYEEYRARLMAGLESHDTAPGMMPTAMNTMPQMGISDEPGTVVISSSGIDTTTGYTSSTGMNSLTGMNTVNSEGGFQQIGMQGGAPLLTADSTMIATINFSSGSSQFDLNDMQILQKVAALQQQSGGTIRIIGHASSRTRSMDPVLHKMVNYNVSVERADAVARQLVLLGASKDSILVGAVSDTQPKFYEVMPSGEAGNRRTEIYFDS